MIKDDFILDNLQKIKEEKDSVLKPDVLKAGVTFLGVTGNMVGGAEIDSSTCTATAKDIRQGKTAVSKNSLINGTLGVTDFQEYSNCLNIALDISKKQFMTVGNLFNPKNNYIILPTDFVDIFVIDRSKVGNGTLYYSFNEIDPNNLDIFDEEANHKLTQNGTNLILREATPEEINSISHDGLHFTDEFAATLDPEQYGEDFVFTETMFALYIGCDKGSQFRLSDNFSFNVHILAADDNKIDLPYNFNVTMMM